MLSDPRHAARTPVPESQICVVGGGPAGLAMALALAQSGQDVTVLMQARGGGTAGTAAVPRLGDAVKFDTRTTAILGDGIAFLKNLGVWDALNTVSAPLTGIRIVDDRGGWLKAPEVLFRSSELDRANFGFNVPNEPLVAALHAAAAAHPRVALVITGGIVDVRPGADTVILTTKEQTQHKAKLAVAADGRQSIVRAAAGIAVRAWDYPQVAVTTSFEHTRTHGGISTELHRRAGPLTTVPLPDGPAGPRSGLVWVEQPADAQRLVGLSDSAFRSELSSRLQGLLGSIGAVGPRGTFPIAGMMAATMGKSRVALAGEAAHVLPPIGAQGLNLGFRDAAALAEAVADRAGQDPGAAAVLAAYGRARSADLISREIGIDALNRSLLSDFLPIQAARGLGLHALANSSLLRRAVMRMGLQGPGPVPPLMRPLANAGG